MASLRVDYLLYFGNFVPKLQEKECVMVVEYKRKERKDEKGKDG